MPAAEFVDLYEILQVSPNAEKDTIKRVHQMLSLKYQLAAPENNAVAYFSQLQQAAATLLDTETRAAYDQERLKHLASLAVPGSAPAAGPAAVPDAPAPVPLAEPAPTAPLTPPPAAAPTPDPDAVPAATDEAAGKTLLNPGRFMEGLDIDGEKRRRAGLIEICYRQRILKPRQPALSVKQLEDGMELTVSELEASLWYLKETDLLRVSDAGNYAVTVRGMNAIEGGFANFVEGRFDMKTFNG